MIKRGKIVHVFITPEIFRQLLNGETFDPAELILDPSEIEDIRDDELYMEIRFTSSVLNKIIHNKFEAITSNGIRTRWELVNCTFEERVKLIHRLDQMRIK